MQVERNQPKQLKPKLAGGLTSTSSCFIIMRFITKTFEILTRPIVCGITGVNHVNTVVIAVQIPTEIYKLG